MIHLYTLSDPRTSAIRYVGAARNPEQRLKRHIVQRRKHAHLDRGRWLIELTDAGLRPVLNVVAILADEEAPEAERALITRLREEGCPLTNVRVSGVRGTGPAGLKRSDETRARMSEAQRKRHASLSPEERQALADRISATKRTPEAQAAQRAHRHPPEVKAKIRAYRHSPETLARMREAQRARREREKHAPTAPSP